MNPIIRKIFLAVGLYDLVVDFEHWLTREDSVLFAVSRSGTVWEFELMESFK